MNPACGRSCKPSRDRPIAHPIAESSTQRLPKPQVAFFRDRYFQLLLRSGRRRETGDKDRDDRPALSPRSQAFVDKR
mgnify:CR=1 FL=1